MYTIQGTCGREGTQWAETTIPYIICVNVMGGETKAQEEAQKYPEAHRFRDCRELSFFYVSPSDPCCWQLLL